LSISDFKGVKLSQKTASIKASLSARVFDTYDLS